MPGLQEQQEIEDKAASYFTDPSRPGNPGAPVAFVPNAEAGRPLGLPDPVFPRPDSGANGPDGDSYNSLNRRRAVQTWLIPYLNSRLHKNELRPIVPYLFTDYKCNLDCHYCWANNNKVEGMTEDVARRSIDWLHSLGCRVLAIMGGEPLLRPGFMQKVIYYAAGRGFFVYLPTNGRLMRPEVIDRLGDAGVAVWNLAVDVVNEQPGLPKALNRIRPYFDYLIRMQHRCGYMVFLNINICRTNLDDVLQLTEIAHEEGIATDYHINETPLIEQAHFRHRDANSTYLTPEEWPRVDELLDWLTEKNRSGYKMINSVRHLSDMKDFMRGKVEPWQCRAGRNSLIIRLDGTLAPCFGLYSAAEDWGEVGNARFDFRQLEEMKKTCSLNCLSTCQHTLGYCYNNMRVLKWLVRQALNGFRGVTGSF